MNIIDNLEKLNFTKLEAQIYMALLGQEAMSAYQVAKKIEMSRPAIYNALEHMLEKGMVEVIPNETLLYQAQESSVILGKMQEELATSLAEARQELESYQKTKYEEVTVNFKGFQTAIYKAKEIIKNAKNEVYINADFDLLYFKEEIKALKKKKIKVVIFSFHDISVPKEVDEYYSHHRKMQSPSRLMLAVDNQIALTVDGSISEESWKGTVSNNHLFIKIISEHIHHDIYLLKLRNKHGKKMYDELYLNTDFEKRQKEVLP